MQPVIRKSQAAAESGHAAVQPMTPAVRLQAHNGVQPHPIKPVPTFHGRPIPVMEGFVPVRDIVLWGNNERLTIHVKHFEKLHGCRPTPAELVDIMRSDASLPVVGHQGKDQFEIRNLARSIATNGVRTPPVIAYDGTLLDGNRRVTASLYVLETDDFTSEQKARVEKIRVWQLTEDAGPDDAEAVVVSLNFEPDYKKPWPEYVKARKVHEEWSALLRREPRASATRQRTLRSELAQQFALRTSDANRYISMVDLADEFEEYQRNERDLDEHEVQHAADRYFQYFDELGKGRGAGGVNYILNQDEVLKHLVFDLLHDGKFLRFSQIRDLKHVHNDDEARENLRRARDEKDLGEAQEIVDTVLAAGRAANASQRRLSGNKRVERFVEWLREVPLDFFSVGEPTAITRPNIKALYAALKLVDAHVPGDVRLEVDGGGSDVR